MSYIPPTLSELIKQSQADFNDITTQTLLVEAVSNALAAQAYGLYGYIEWLSRQIVPHLADETYLLKFCTFWGVWRKEQTTATGYLNVTAMDGSVINKGVQWKNKRGIVIESTDSLVAADNSVLIPVKATIAGADSNCAEGDVFELISPIAGVESKAILSTDGLTGGTDVESLAALRARLLFRVQYPPSGGNRFDYVRWALECAGITRAWCIPAPMYTNYITVLCVLDEQLNIIPTQSDLTRVSNYIEGHINEITNQWEGKPAGAELIMKAPKLKAINPNIKIYPDKPELRENVTESLQSLLYGISIGNTVYLSQLRAAISNVTGIIDCSILNINDDITTQYDELAIVGVITWQ